MTEGIHLADIGFDEAIRNPRDRVPYMGIPQSRRTPLTNVFTGRVHRKPSHNLPKLFLDRDKRHKDKLIRMLEANFDFIGRSYSYKVMGSKGLGEFSVYGVAVLTLNLIDGTILLLRIPSENQVPTGQYQKQMNLTRLLFRRLGLNAIRNKDFTVIETNGYLKVLEPGETWELPTLASPIVLPSKIKKDWTQLPLISDELYTQAERTYKDEKQRKYNEEITKKQRENIGKFFTGTSPYTGSTTATSSIPSGTSTWYTGDGSASRIYRFTT